ncbi:HAD hydrolase family protein [Pseudomonas sp.]|uniref:KdsC family phosphatase n=1 Tax=Pseudomonas sp. TaxID=306 RepID=UPI003242A4D0
MESGYRGPVRLVIFDIDGVMTDGTLHIGDDGEQFKAFNVRDGIAISLLRAHGISSGVLSGKACKALDYRIRQLKFDLAVTGEIEKLAAYSKIKAEQKLSDAQIAYVGDDVVDLPLAGLAGNFYAPADAHPLVLSAASHITTVNGGRGVAREVAEHILLAGGLTLEEMYRPLMNQWKRYDTAQ